MVLKRLTRTQRRRLLIGAAVLSVALILALVIGIGVSLAGGGEEGEDADGNLGVPAAPKIDYSRYRNSQQLGNALG